MGVYLGSTRLDGTGGSTTITGDGIVAVSSLADLTALTPADGDAIKVLGHTTKNDGGGGLYVWDAAAADSKMLSAATVNAGGTGYEVGDLIWIVGGTYGNDQAFVRVATVSGSAVVTVSLVYNGIYSTATGTTAIATTSRDGTGCTLNLTWVSRSNYGTYVPKNGGGIGRWSRIDEDATGRVSVKVFGAKGDGATNDWLAIQRAIWSGKQLFFPEGTFIVLEPLTFLMSRPIDITGAGSRDGWGGSILALTKNTDEPLIHPFGRYMKSNGVYQFETGFEVGGAYLGGVSSRFNIQDIKLYSANSIYSCCCELTLIGQAFFRNVTFQTSFRGLTIGQATYDVTILHCYFLSSFMGNFPWAGTTGGESNKTIARRAWGLCTTGHTFIYGGVAVGNGVGFRLTGVGIAFSGARIEVNNYGVLIANSYYALEAEWLSSLSRSSITGISLEANTIGVEVDAMSDSTISGVGIQGSITDGVYRPDGEIGLYLVGMHPTSNISNIAAGGKFTRGAFVNRTRHPIQNSEFNGETISYARTNTIFGGSGGQASYRATGFRNEVSSISTFRDLMVPHLSGLNLRDGQVMGRNLGDVARPTTSATSVNVTFTTTVGYAIYAFSGLPTSVDATSTLAAGTYYYATTLVAKHAEHGINYADATIHSHKTVVVPAGHSVLMSFYGGAGSWMRRRVYRTSANAVVGAFEGYWEFPSSDASFRDYGQAFQKRGQPPEDGDIPTCVEIDANYRVVVTPSWNTSTWVTNIATTGFTINFGTAAPASQTVSWLVFRP